MTTNVWVDQTWMDYKLRWNPDVSEQRVTKPGDEDHAVTDRHKEEE